MFWALANNFLIKMCITIIVHNIVLWTLIVWLDRGWIQRGNFTHTIYMHVWMCMCDIYMIYMIYWRVFPLRELNWTQNESPACWWVPKYIFILILVLIWVFFAPIKAMFRYKNDFLVEAHMYEISNSACAFIAQISGPRMRGKVPTRIHTRIHTHSYTFSYHIEEGHMH